MTDAISGGNIFVAAAVDRAGEDSTAEDSTAEDSTAEDSTAEDSTEAPGEDGMESWPIGRLLSTAARLVEHAWADALEELGLTHAGLIILHLLGHGPLDQTELARRARVETQTVSRTIDRLERQGFVERTPDVADRRRRLVARTPAGEAVWAASRSLEAEMFPTLDDPELVRRALLGVIRSMSKIRWTDVGEPTHHE
jgi:DNA-binding MarR family transcriptional regulator